MAKSSSRAAKVYRFKVDVWLAALIGVSMLMAIIGVAAAGLQEGPMRFTQGFFGMLGVFGFLVWTFMTTNYTLTSDDLLVQSGPFRWRIPINEISSIEKPTGLLPTGSSPALSLDRLVVTYGKGKRVMISPAEKEKFLADLKARQK